MIRNYFKTAWRTLTRNRAYSLITILGLTIGLSAFMLVSTVVMDDLSYDRQWSRGERIFRLVSVDKMGAGLYNKNESSYTGMLTHLKTEFPEVETGARISSSDLRLKLNATDESGISSSFIRADSTIWEMLDLEILAGTPGTLVQGTRNLVITESYRDKYFRGEDPVGKTVYDVPSFTSESTPYLITGVIRDLPANSIFRADMLLVTKPSAETLSAGGFRGFSRNYVLVKPGTDVEALTRKVNSRAKDFDRGRYVTEYEFQPLKAVYLHSDFAAGQSVKGDIKNVWIFTGVAVLLLLIACGNFVNLSSARAVYRLKETGVRKILGADKSRIILQFLTESFLFFAIASVGALIIYTVGLPRLEHFVEHPLTLTLFSGFRRVAAALLFIVLLSMLTGIYPALIISGFKTSNALKGNTGRAGNQNRVRRTLVVGQFAVSIVVLISLMVVQMQVRYLNNKDLGFDKENLLSIDFTAWEGKGEAFKNELLRQTGIESVSIANWIPSRGAGSMSRKIQDPQNPDKTIQVNYINGDTDLGKTLGLKLERGRFLGNTLSYDKLNTDQVMEMDSAQSMNAYLNQSTLVTAFGAKAIGISDLEVPDRRVPTRPVGIVKDFHNESLKNPLQPTFIAAESSSDYGGMLIRVEPGHTQQAAEAVQTLLKQFYPGKYLEMNWVDDLLAKQYRTESRLLSLFSFFSGLSMFLAALGIFGLVTQALAQRVKEIGIRKVLGAPVHAIVRLFSVDFLKLVVMATVLASPVAWWLMNRWLADFAYRITIPWGVFALAGGIAVTVALLTISFQTIKSALANPVKALRTE
ncbi:FtsX-like permease family protein [Leadbetterella sp. DM7]|uniref:FtsX-like permease family protein n=1 Tax=Leadbetterella sp. DM7 TaxID=3235085 RepID=UPI00349EADFC